MSRSYRRNITAFLTICTLSQLSNAFVTLLADHHTKSHAINTHYAENDGIKLFSTPKNQENEDSEKSRRTKYVLGQDIADDELSASFWGTCSVNNAKLSVDPPKSRPQEDSVEDDVKIDSTYKLTGKYDLGLGKNTPIQYKVETKQNDPKELMVKNKEGQFLSRACWFYDGSDENAPREIDTESETKSASSQTVINVRFEDIDQSIPETAYDPSKGIDLVWSLLRQEARVEAEREPLLVSFLYSTILNHRNLESALAFHLANRLASPSMDSIQVMTIILDALTNSPTFQRDLRADLIAVRDRDPACTCLPDVFLYFKGFHALQSYRVSNYLWKQGKKTIAHYVQSQMSQNFQIDIHPNATLRSGIMLDHGTGIVIGETATVGYNCSILHHVTLGGSGKRGVDRHPKVGDGVLLGAGSTILGNIDIGDGCQVGAGTLVIDNLPPHSVAVGVPSKIIGSYKSSIPSQTMSQVGSSDAEKLIDFMGGI